MGTDADKAMQEIFGDAVSPQDKQARVAEALQAKPRLLATAMQDDNGRVTSESIENFLETHHIEIAHIDKGKVVGATPDMLPEKLQGMLNKLAKDNDWRKVDKLDSRDGSEHLDTMVIKQILGAAFPQAIVREQYTIHGNEKGLHYKTAGYIDPKKIPDEPMFVTIRQRLLPELPEQPEQPEHKKGPVQPTTPERQQQQPVSSPDQKSNPELPSHSPNQQGNPGHGQQEHKNPGPRIESRPREKIPNGISGEKPAAERVAANVIDPSERARPKLVSGILTNTVMGIASNPSVQAPTVGGTGQGHSQQR